MSVNWLEFLDGQDRLLQMAALRGAYRVKGFDLRSTARFAVLNVIPLPITLPGIPLGIESKHEPRGRLQADPIASEDRGNRRFGLVPTLRVGMRSSPLRGAMALRAASRSPIPEALAACTGPAMQNVWWAPVPNRSETSERRARSPSGAPARDTVPEATKLTVPMFAGLSAQSLHKIHAWC